MKNFLPVAAVVAVSALTASAVQSEELSDAVLQPTGLRTVWVSQAVLNTSRDQVTSLKSDEELLYVQSSAGVVTALNAENGRRMWASQIGRNDEHAMAASSNRDTLLIITGPVVNGLNKFTGDELFHYRLPSQPSAPAGMNDNTFFIPLVDGSVVTYSLRTLAFQERYGELPPGIATPLAWRYFSGERVRFAPVAGTETIAIGSEAGSVHAMNAAGLNAGKSLYQLFLKSPISAPLTNIRREEGEVLLTATSNNRLFCLGLGKGARMLWTYPMSRGITEPLLAVGDNVYVITDGGGLTSLSLTEGLPVKTETGSWYVPGMESVVAVSMNRVYAVDVTQRLTVIDRATAAVLARVPVPGHPLRIRNSLTDRIYLSTGSGRVVCLAEVGSDFASYHQNPDRQPVMPAVSEPAAAAPAPPEPAEDSQP